MTAFVPDRFDGAVTFAGTGRSSVVWLDTESGWRSDDSPELAALLAVAIPWPPESGGFRGYDPNPALTAIQQAAERFGGTITQEPQIIREPGKEY